VTADRLTLDTNIVRERWDQRPKRPLVEQILDLADRGIVDLAVTSTIHLDIPHDPLARRISELPEIGIEETGTVARLGSWVLGRDMLASQEFGDWHEGLELTEPDTRDFDHLHAHMLLGRDYFLTWDKAILNLTSELATQWGIRVRRPEDYLNENPPPIDS
jgi:hypothetical protein